MVLSVSKAGRVLVVGDVMLDRYVHGQVARVSPEAPVPVLQWARDESVAGGAANVAALGPSSALSRPRADQPETLWRHCAKGGRVASRCTPRTFRHGPPVLGRRRGRSSGPGFVEHPPLLSDAVKAREKLGWHPAINLDTLLADMVREDLATMARPARPVRMNRSFTHG